MAPVPPAVPHQPKISLLLDNLYHIVLESRTDWLAIEGIIVANALHRPIEDEAAFAAQVRSVFREETERLAARAIATEKLSIGDLSDSI